MQNENEQGPPKKRGRRTWVIAGLITIPVIALLAAVFFLHPFHKQPGVSVQPSEPPAPTALGTPSSTRITTFLILGADKRPDDVGRADTMIVGSYDEANERLAMVSIPRDTYTYVKGYDYTKLNHSYAYGGTQLTRSTIQRLIDLPIDHYVLVNFQGFMKFVDTLGGVEIDAEKRLYYVDPEDTGMGPNGLVIDIQPGRQLMDGYNALAYARFRKDEEGDIGRMRRQQQVIEAVVRELTQPATFAKIPRLIPAVFGTIETDLTMAQMIGYGLSGKSAMERGIAAASITGSDLMLDEIYYLVPNIVDLRTLVYQTLMGTAPPPEYLAKAEADQADYEEALRQVGAISSDS